MCVSFRVFVVIAGDFSADDDARAFAESDNASGPR